MLLTRHIEIWYNAAMDDKNRNTDIPDDAGDVFDAVGDSVGSSETAGTSSAQCGISAPPDADADCVLSRERKAVDDGNIAIAQRSNRLLWIVIAVMTAMCLAVGVCSSLLTARFLRGGAAPPIIRTDGKVQQNIAGVVAARKSGIAEVHCSGLSSSGIVMKRDGANVYVMTNAHAIAAYVNSGAAPSVRFYGEDQFFQATVVGYEAFYDIAVLAVAHDTVYEVYNLDGSPFFSPSVEYAEGDYVVSIGNALGRGIASYDGIISRSSELWECNELFKSGKKTVPVIRTTAVINAGMSGGGVFDMQGNLIGLGTYRVASSLGVDTDGGANTDVEDTGLSTPVSIVYPVYKRIMEVGGGGAVGVMPVRMQSTQTSAIGWMSFPIGFNCAYRSSALTVVSLDQGTPASGVSEGDIMLKIGDYDISSDICRAVGEFISYGYGANGKKLQITFKRESGNYTLSFSDYGKYAA